jgi:hypothetical protein
VSNPYLEKLRSIGYLSRGRTRAKVREGREHPESGRPFKAITDEFGNVTTEHDTRDDRVDVNIQAPHIRVEGTTREIR